MNPAHNKYLRFASFLLLGIAFLVSPLLHCFAGEYSEAQKHPLTDAISIILRDELLKKDDLSQLTDYELQIVRNAVFARHGKDFKRPELADYFSRRSWYKLNKGFTEDRITANDRKNVTQIQKVEHDTPHRPDNSTIKGAMQLYLGAFFRADSDAFLSLCNPKHPPRFTGYKIGSLKRQRSWVMERKELEADFATKGVHWMDYFGDVGGAAQYRWTIFGTTVEDWKRDGDLFRLPSSSDPKAEKAIYVRWQKIDGRYYIAEIADILC